MYEAIVHSIKPDGRSASTAQIPRCNSEQWPACGRKRKLAFGEMGRHFSDERFTRNGGDFTVNRNNKVCTEFLRVHLNDTCVLWAAAGRREGRQGGGECCQQQRRRLKRP
ncbi:hypothetical protein EVAR_94112_1 [Eumeta japonica]|uniref:Uncharacterized protein n=1 Tax=Eumeta variegata TaxID=151549 RepID=A0A4C1U816_EUMVA|nr:hypothetical protein EVAR_94112_1 [Eumeta japonica]